MSTAAATPPLKKPRLRLRTAALLLFVAALAGLFFYLRSDSFRETVRARVVAELERMTGGKVEITSFTWQLSSLRFVADGLTIHGNEAPGQAPFAHADRVTVDVKIISLLSRKISLNRVLIERPVVHLIVYPDGSTNQPLPKVSEAASDPAQQMFDLNVQHVEVTNGTLMLNDEQFPFELAGDRLAMGMVYSTPDHGYNTTLSVKLLSGRYRNVAPRRGDLDLNLLVRATETEIKSLKLSTDVGALQAKGSLRSYNNPDLRLQYNAAAELREIAREANLPELRAGRAALKGGFIYQNRKYSSQGELSIRGAEWRDADVHVANVEVDSPFTLTMDKIAFPRLVARALGGSVKGDVEITNWAGTPAGKKPAPPKGTFTLEVSGLQVNQVSAALTTPHLPLDKIEAAGSISGQVKATWSGSIDRLLAEMKLDVAPPPNPTAQQVPVTAQFRATYHGDSRTLDVATLNLSTRAIHLNASGQLGSDTAQARLTVTSTDLHEIKPALAALAPGTRIPVLLEGHASFNGTVSGRLNALTTRGRLDLENFDTELAPLQLSAVGTTGGQHRLHWDSLSADALYSPSTMSLQHGVLRRGKANVNFSASAALHSGVLDENTSQVTFNVRMQDVRLEDIQGLAGMNYPVTGLVIADASASGTPVNLHGSGNLQITNMTVMGEPFRSFRSQVQIAGTEVQLTNLTLVHNGAQATGMFAYNYETRGFRFDVQGDKIDLATLRGLQAPRFVVEGMAAFHVTGSIDKDTPVINGSVDLRNLAVNHEAVGSMNFTGETRGTDLQLHGRSQFENASLKVDGSIQLRGDLPAQLTLEFTRLDFDPLIRAYVQGPLTGHSSMAGSLSLRGPLRRPRDLVVQGNVTQLAASWENVKLQNDGPVRFSMENETVRVEQFHLVGDNTDLSMTGNVHLSQEQSLDLRTRGRFDLKLLQGFNSDILAYGPAVFTVDIRGNAARPLLSGRLDLKDAGVSLADLPNGLSQINGTMVFAQDGAHIEKLKARSGGGDLDVSGFLAYRNGLYFDLTASSTDVRLRYPPGVSASANAQLRYTGSARSSMLSGDVVVTRFGTNPHFDFGLYLAQSKKTPVLATLNPFLDNLRLDVHITSTPELRVETSLAKLSGDLDLHLRGTAARPALLGRVNIAEGDVFFNGTKYRLERGDVTFANPLAIEPIINVDMSARVQAYDITIGLHGAVTSAKGLSMTYRSDPPLSNADIISLLAFGRTRGPDFYSASQAGGSTQNTSDTATASNAILGQALNATFSDRVQRLFGASRVKIDPQFIGSGNNPSARVTIEQNINNNMTLTYITSLTQSAETVIQVEYNVDKNISIVAVRDQNGILGFDVHIRRRAK